MPSDPAREEHLRQEAERYVKAHPGCRYVVIQIDRGDGMSPERMVVLGPAESESGDKFRHLPAGLPPSSS